MKRVTLYVPEHQWRQAHEMLPATFNFSACFQGALAGEITRAEKESIDSQEPKNGPEGGAPSAPGGDSPEGDGAL